jgi:hypothetical protein
MSSLDSSSSDKINGKFKTQKKKANSNYQSLTKSKKNKNKFSYKNENLTSSDDEGFEN